MARATASRDVQFFPLFFTFIFAHGYNWFGPGFHRQ
jgi:hypothetical protein